MMVISITMAQRLGIKTSEMIPTSMNITTANGNSMDILRGIWIKMIHSFKGNVMESHQLAYVAAGAKQLFICRMALCDLSLIPKVWPHEGSSDMTPPTKGVPTADENIGDTMAAVKEDRICKCPTRTRPLEPPHTIPFAPMEKNVPKLKQ